MKKLDERKIIMETKELYKRIQEDNNPIFIWGTGALARDIYKYCENFNIKIEAFFVNDGKLLEEFEGHRVFSLEEVVHNYQKISVIIGHHHYESGIRFLDEIKNIEKIYTIPVVSYEMWDDISLEELHYNKDRWEGIYKQLEDDMSRKCLAAYLKARIQNDAREMFGCYDETKNYYTQDFLELSGSEIFLDIGACLGEAIWSFISAVSGKYKKIIALEPETKNYEKLDKMIKQKNCGDIELKKVCAWKEAGKVQFQGDGELGGITDDEDNGSYERQAVAIDCFEEKFSLIKINFPYSVSEVLEGGDKLLKYQKPKLIIRIGFNEKLVLDTFEKIKEINNKYHIYFRYTLGMPEGLTLYAV